MTTQLRVLTTVSKSYVSILDEYFLATLPKEVENVKILFLNVDSFIGSSAAHVFETKKLEFLCEEIKAHMGDNIFYIDGDVVFAYESPFVDEINGLLEEKDILFQFNDQWYNFGVFALKCSAKTLEYFEHMLHVEMEKHKNNAHIHDQHICNAMLGVQDFDPVPEVEKVFENIAHGSLPLRYFANHFRGVHYPGDVPEDVVFLHATNTYTRKDKLNLLTHFKHHHFERKKE